MKIRLEDYKLGVMTKVREDYDPNYLELEFVDLKYSKPLNLQGTVEKGMDILTFRGELTSEIDCTCGRCLKTMHQSIRQPFEFFYETAGKEVIETIDDIREVLILEHPLSFVCKENCRGLCPECGVDRNEKECDCNVPENSSLFTSLKDIWMKRKKEKSHGQS